MPIADILFQDSFTDAANTRLDAHTPDVGEGWCCLETTFVTIPANRLEVNGAGTGLVSSIAALSRRATYATRERMTTPDVRVRITVTTAAVGAGEADDPFWLLGRVCCPNNLYGAGSYGSAAPNQEIYKKVGGVVTQIATVAGAVANGDYFEFYLRGSRLELHKNGSLVVGGSDSALPSAGRSGFSMGDLFVAGDDVNTTWVFDDYSVKALRHRVRYDSFTDADSTPLTSHIPDQGSGWVFLRNTYAVANSGTNYMRFVIASNAVGADHGSIGTGMVCVLHPEQTGCEYAVEATVASAYVGATSYLIGLVARATDYQNYYDAFTAAAGVANDKRLYKCVAGVYTLLAQTDTGISVGDVLRLEVENGAQRFYKNDVLQASAADTALTGAGSAGIGVGSALDGAGHVDEDWTLDDFKVHQFGGPLSRDGEGTAYAVREVSAATVNVNSRDHLLICQTNSNAIAVNLPPAGQKKGRELVFRNIGSSANDATLDPEGSEQIDGAGSATVVDDGARIIRSTGTEWFTVGLY